LLHITLEKHRRQEMVTQGRRRRTVEKWN